MWAQGEVHDDVVSLVRDGVEPRHAMPEAVGGVHDELPAREPTHHFEHPYGPRLVSVAGEHGGGSAHGHEEPEARSPPNRVLNVDG